MRVSWFTIAAAIVAGGVIHIAAVLSVPYLAREDAWGRLARFSSVNQLYLLPPGAPRLVPLPHAAPDMAYAFCRFLNRPCPARSGAQPCITAAARTST